MSAFDFDLVVIGGGSGGVRAGRIAASLGARVLIIEAREWGGTCVHRGCVPKKIMSYAAHAAGDLEDARHLGWRFSEATHDWAALCDARDRELNRLNGVYERMLRGAGCALEAGHARVVGPHEVEVNGKILRGERLLIATGGRPVTPDIPGAALGISSDGFFRLRERPQRVVVVGGGYIGVELASVLRGLGSEVRLVHRADQVLRGFDDEARAHLAAAMRAQGVRIDDLATVDRVERGADGLIAWIGAEPHATDALIWATGRAPNTEGLGLAEVGVALGARGEVRIDDRWCTSVPSIYAVGDVTDRLQLTPVALAEGMQLAGNLFGGQDAGLAYTDVPTTVFAEPNLATVGLTEAEAARAGEVRVFTSRFRPLKHTIGPKQAPYFMKLVVDAASDRVVGVHVVGPEAGEILQGFAVAVKLGATKAQLDQTLGIHPTAAEELVTMRTPRA